MTTTTTTSTSNPPLKLSQLRNFCKRDPPAYKEDYDAQSRRLSSLVSILLISPNADPSPNLVELIQFMAAVSSSSYKGEESDKVANTLMDLLVGTEKGAQTLGIDGQNATLHSSLPTAALTLHRDIRKACVSALILMRNKGAVPPLRLLQLFFQLMAAVSDKNLRECLYHHIVNDVRNINKQGKRDEKLNRTIQGFFHRLLGAATNSKPGDIDGPIDYAAKRAVQMTCELYRRNVWTDERSIHILATAASSPNANVMSRALRFFLNIEEAMALDAKAKEDTEFNVANRIDMHLHSKKTKARIRQVEKAVRARQKKQLAREQHLLDERDDRGVESSKKLFPAIELLNDPQGLAELLLKRIKNASAYKFEVKMLMLNFVTRVVGNHELILLPLYPLLQRYLGGHQRDVTAILAYCVQSCHSYVPPEEVYPLLKAIAHNFITERCSGEQMAVGVNAVRAICARVPSVLAEGDTANGGDNDGEKVVASTEWDVQAFVQDLAGYAKHKDRSVSIAGRGWVNFIREVYPSLLRGKDRGLVGTGLHREGERPLRYGEVKAASGVEGADLLVAYENRKRVGGEDGGGEEESGDEQDDGEGQEEDEGSWVEVNDDDNSEIEIDEEEAEESSDDEAPELTLLEGDEDTKPPAKSEEQQQDLSELSKSERAKLQQQVSSTRIFTTAEFAKMQKLVERQQRARRDPRLAAKLKRAKAKGNEFADLSDDESDVDSDDEDIRISGAVTPTDIMADAKRKRMSKAEKLQKILEGRQKWEAKDRAGGSTNIEKKRNKSFTMSKFSFEARKKRGEKSTAKQGKKNKRKMDGGRDSKKRRRKM